MLIAEDATTDASDTPHVYTLDALGRKTSETVTYGTGANAFTKTLQYTYDEDGRLAEMVYPEESR